MTIEIEEIHLFLLVLVRLAGMILLNPLLARRNVPARVRMGLVLGLTILVAPTVEAAAGLSLDTFSLVFAMLRELILGMVCGYVFQVFYYMLFFVGDHLDVEFGMSMAKVFDPGTNIQMSLTGNLLSIMFIFYLLATNGHLQMIYLFAASFQSVPLGGAIVTRELAQFGINLFISLFTLSIRLTLPFMAAAFALQVSMGVLMKLIPQINVFAVNFQFKQGLGLLLLFLIAPLIGNYMDRYIVLLIENMQRAMTLLS